MSKSLLLVSFCLISCELFAQQPLHADDSGLFNYFIFGTIFCLVIIAAVAFYKKIKLERRFDFYNQIVNHSNSLVVVSDKNGKIIYVSENAKEILGYKSEELLGEAWWEKTIDKRTKRENAQGKKELLDKLKNEVVTTRLIRCKDETYKWIQWHDKKFHENLIVGIGQDVTALKDIELKYQKRQEKLLNRQQLLNEISLLQFEKVNSKSGFIDLVLEKASKGIEVDVFSYMAYEKDELQTIAIFKNTVEAFSEGIAIKEKNHPSYFAALKSGKPLVVEDVYSNALTTEYTTGYFDKNNIESVLDIPILINGKLKYLISCETIKRKVSWDGDDVNFLKSVAEMILIFIENDKQKQIEQRVIENEKILRQINETIDGVFWLYNNIENVVEYISPSCTKILGVSPESFYKNNDFWKNYVLEEDKMRIFESHRKLETEGFYEVEYRIVKDGEIRWIKEKSYPAEMQNGRILKNSGLCTDITHEKEAQDEMSKLSLIAEKTTNAVAMTDAEGNVFWVNKAFLDLFEIPKKEILGKKSRDLFIKDKKTLEKVTAKNGMNFRMELEIETYLKNEIWIEFSNTIVKNETGEVLYQIDIISDITKQINARKKIENQALILEVYNKELEYQNTLKERLLEANDLETLSKSTLGLIKSQFTGVSRVSLFFPDYYEQVLSGFSLSSDDEFKKEDFYVNEFHSYQQTKSGNLYLVEDLASVENKSVSDVEYEQSGIRSYIGLPLAFDDNFLGILIVCYNEVLSVNYNQLHQLRDACNVISVSANQLKLKEDIQSKNKDILASIHYARNIQKAVLTDVKNFSKHISDVVLFYQPKDIVSGDFYWSKDSEFFSYLALGDCTGHGVPGAFLTLMGINILEQLIGIEKRHNPAEILTELDKRLFHILNENNDEGSLNDGMELALCIYDKINRKMIYSGATLGVLYFKEGKDMHVRGQRVTIGEKKDPDFHFVNTEIEINENTYFYMATDGYQDQLGGERNKRFSAQKLINLLNDVKELSVDKQEERIEESMLIHMNGNEQLDDFTILGFKVTK